MELTRSDIFQVIESIWASILVRDIQHGDEMAAAQSSSF